MSNQNEREEYLKKLGLERSEAALPPEGRKNTDRRKARSVIGRERYLDMVLKERALFAQQGFSRSAEQLLSASGAGTESEVVAGERDSATGDQLRALLPLQTWLPRRLR